MPEKQGNLSINSENIFPIIKKWLYSDHDIFYRELISNGCDAITKLKKLDVMGEFEIPEDTEFKIQVTVDPDEKTISFKDNGIGMTFEELDEYINQIAFSGAKDFLEKYKDKTNEDQIIGHFGLGFYSSFMVADKVSIDTKSYRADAPAVHWESDGGQEFAMAEGSKEDFGTEITLYLNEDSLEFANEYKAREVIEKYCSFMPVNIFLNKANAPQEYETIDVSEVTEKDVVVETTIEEAKTEERENENGEKEIVEISPRKELAKINKRPVPLNDVHPLWTKHPNECTDEEYKKFYRTVFNDYKEPLFWIHLNMDYPFNLKGILYFPKIGSQYESIEGTIKLYNSQVFVADNIKEVIPEFLMLLKGVIDCPDLPLNVSRSALQNDGFVKKISDYITKKVADKLTGMYKVEKENYEKYWDDLSPFIKFGYIRDEKFEDKIKDCILFKNLEGRYLTLAECLEENKEAHENTVFYVTDEKAQSQYINMFKEAGIDAVILTHTIDSPFISHVEQKNENVHFLRIDTDLDSAFKEETGEEEKESLSKMTDKLTETFRKALGDDKLEVKVEKLKNSSIASVVTSSEDSRRMQDMMKMYSMGDMNMDMFGASESLVLNANHPLVTYVLEHEDSEDTSIFCEQLYDLALLSHGSLSPERMSKFIARTNDVMLKLAE
ncbi:molecular chaperone HtpG [Qiania dongpingensis]|uniref:Molecular chaperone HtpG n=1 Tax=Qiania dongpingensis TaxID=2763669 RepID=A0A7G9G659_9FIRM|nr:molecular chaperone HtpG [Qiania dongpingensis]QNM06291.1 molecular chaperone HtpG [Qiania dongpingensis]